MGNGPFAVPILLRIAESRHSVSMVVARPDRPSGKHRLTVAGPVRTAAEQRKLPVVQPEDVNDADFVSQLVDASADALVVADFGQILNSGCLSSTRLGGYNVHASLLPKYRGAAPVAWAIYHGESRTGVSIIRMSRVLDAGGVVHQTELTILPSETAGDLEARLAEVGASAMTEVLAKLESGTASLIEQDPIQATRAPRLKKEDGRIRWERSALLVDAQVRAMQPWPVAYTDWTKANAGPLRLQVLNVDIGDLALAQSWAPGEVVSTNTQGILVATGERGSVLIRRIRPAGKRDMDASTFLNGHGVKPGDFFC